MEVLFPGPTSGSCRRYSERCVPSTGFCTPGKVDMESTQVAHIVTTGSTLKKILRKLYLRTIKLYALF